MRIKRMTSLIAVFLILNISTTAAQAGGIPVVDAANLAQAVQQVEAWARQFEQMTRQFEQLRMQYESMTGPRAMAELINHPELRQYLPDDYESIMASGYGAWQSIRQTARLVGLDTSMLDPESDAAKTLELIARNAAVNQAMAQDAYQKASVRFGEMQILINKINDAPDMKAIQDLQARIQSEQLMLQNEAIKLDMLARLEQTQRNIQLQRAAERRMMSTQGPMPKW